MAVQDPLARGVYAISVAADMVGIGQQNLRLYERRGLLEPVRTSGGTRQYSEHDVAVLRRITELLAEGLNLKGIRLVLGWKPKTGPSNSSSNAAPPAPEPPPPPLGLRPRRPSAQLRWTRPGHRASPVPGFSLPPVG